MDVERCKCAMDGRVSFWVKSEQKLHETNKRASFLRSESRSMATVVPCASCYGFFGRGPGGGYMSLLTNHGPRGAPPPTLARHTPNMTLRQICHMLRLMRQVRRREAAAAAASARKQTAGLTAPSSPSEKRCLPGFLRRRRTNNIKKSEAALLDDLE